MDNLLESKVLFLDEAFFNSSARNYQSFAPKFEHECLKACLSNILGVSMEI